VNGQALIRESLSGDLSTERDTMAITLTVCTWASYT